MTTIVTRAGKGLALSYTEMDANFNNLNNDKLEASDLLPYATTASVNLAISNMLETTDIGGLVQAYSTNLDEYATVNPTPAGLALLDDADAAAQRTTLGLGTAATATLGTGSGQVPTADQIAVLVPAELPTQTGNSGKFLKTNGSSASWGFNITSGTVAASTSGTSIDFTGIPSGVKRITVMMSGTSTNGSSNLRLQIGPSGGVETSGYSSSAAIGATYGLDTGGFAITANIAAASVSGGIATLALLDASTNLWCCSGTIGYSNAAGVSYFGGSKAISGALSRLRLTTVNGTDTFDAGSINIMYE